MVFKKILCAAFVCLIVLSANAQQSAVKGNNTLSFELLKKISDGNGNVFLSPYSISSALAMTYAGARSETKQQMSNVLHFDMKDINTHKEFAEMNSKLDKYKKSRAIQLNVANALWLDKTWHFKSDYLALTQKYYKSSLFGLTDAKAINEWVSSNTNQKINEIVTDEDLKNIRLVLTNAIYFKGEWINSFSESATKEEPFFVSNDVQTRVPIMNQATVNNYYEDEQNQVIEIPYKDRLASMIIILPQKREGFEKMLQSMNNEKYESYLSQLKSAKVNVYLPKFSVNSDIELQKNLSDMGMPLAFDPTKADFTGMSSGLSIDKVKHKSFIEVTEQGSEAAAATAVTVQEKSIASVINKEITFRADHPFLFIIKDNETGVILFIGSFINPSADTASNR